MKMFNKIFICGQLFKILAYITKPIIRTDRDRKRIHMSCIAQPLKAACVNDLIIKTRVFLTYMNDFILMNNF